MYSTKVSSSFYIATIILLGTMTQLVSALPKTPSEVITENQDRACRSNQCYIRNGTNATDAVAAANAAASTAAPVPILKGATTNGAIAYEPVVMIPAMIAGTSLLLLL